MRDELSEIKGLGIRHEVKGWMGYEYDSFAAAKRIRFPAGFCKI